MEEKLTREEVLHVAELARIKITEEEIERYQVQLKQLLNDVEKINDVEGYDDDLSTSKLLSECIFTLSYNPICAPIFSIDFGNSCLKLPNTCATDAKEQSNTATNVNVNFFAFMILTD